jgi:vacuolar-type H+-ATPase subunit F/Vma7
MSSDSLPARDGTPGAQVGVVGRAEVTARVEELACSGLTVLFYTEDLYPYLAGIVSRCSRTATPCLVMLPMGAEQHGLARLREIVRRSVGADVFGQGPAGDKFHKQ